MVTNQEVELTQCNGVVVEDTIQQSTVPYLSLSTSQSYPDSLNGLYKLRYRQTSLWILAFYLLIAAPSIIVGTCIRALAVRLGIATTWDLWDAFKLFTEPSCICSPDHAARLQIDFSIVQNCRAWYELRKHLCEITNINLRTAIPMLRIAVILYVLAVAAVCWYAAVSKALIPEFAFLICLCVNSLVVLMFSVPLTLIWRMQFGHIALLPTTLRQVEMLPATTDPIEAEQRRQAARVLSAIKTELEVSNKRVSVLGLELSPGFLQTIATFAATGISILLGSKIQYTVTGGAVSSDFHWIGLFTIANVTCTLSDSPSFGNISDLSRQIATSLRITPNAVEDVSSTLVAECSSAMLTAVGLVCDTDASVAALPHVALTIDAFLDSSVDQWTLERASKRGFVRLLHRLKQQESPQMSTSFREERFKAATRIAVRDGNVASLHWWMTTYLPDTYEDLVLENAIQHEQLDVLEYLWQHNGSTVQDWDWSKGVTCDKPAFAYWLHDHISGVALTLRTNEYSDFEFVKWAHAHRDTYASN